MLRLEDKGSRKKTLQFIKSRHLISKKESNCNNRVLYRESEQSLKRALSKCREEETMVIKLGPLFKRVTTTRDSMKLV